VPDRFISDDDAERLLAGSADVAGVDGGLSDLARLLAAARQMDDPQDQAAADRLLPQLVALVHTGGPDSTHRRSAVIHKIVTGKVAAIAAATLLTAGVAAAAAGSMPASSSHANVAVPANASKPDTPTTDESIPETDDTEAPEALETADTETAATSDTTAIATEDAITASTPDSTPVGPDVTGPAQFGLCTAWSASGKPKNPDAIAFRNLIAAAGSADAVEGWCAPVLAEHEAAKTAAAAKGKSGETHGKSGETHGKSGEAHGKP
jgi:hypothetical protein